jgi:hypothetical protein
MRTTTFEIAEIKEMSGLSIPQIEQAISRERLPVQGEGSPGRARQFSVADAFNFCVIGEMRRLGIDWKRVIGSTAMPWPTEDVFEIDKQEFFLLTPMLGNHRTASEDAPKNWEINLVPPDELLGYLRAYKARAAVVLDASEIAKHIETFRPQLVGDIVTAGREGNGFPALGKLVPVRRPLDSHSR